MIWKDVNGFEGYYQVSTYGRIRSVDRKITQSNGVVRFYPSTEIQPFINRYGYLKVGFNVCGRKTNHAVHRLVAETFLLNNKNKPEVNHINSIKTNNRVNNLEWVTSKTKHTCLLYTSPSPRDGLLSRMPSSA